MAFAEVGTHYGNVILVNEGFKPSSENVNGNSCPEMSQKVWRLFPSSNKRAVEIVQTLQCSESRKYSADAVSVPKWGACGFFWQRPACVGGVHTAFPKGCSEVERAPEGAWVMADDALQPCERELNLPFCSTLRASQHTQHRYPGFLKKCSFVLQEAVNHSDCQSKLKQSCWWKNRHTPGWWRALSTHLVPLLCAENSAGPQQDEALGWYRVRG